MKKLFNFDSLSTFFSVLVFISVNIVLCSWTTEHTPNKIKYSEYISLDTIDLGKDTIVTFDSETYTETIRVFSREQIQGDTSNAHKQFYSSFDTDIFDKAAASKDQSLFIIADTIITFNPETFQEKVDIINTYLLEEIVHYPENLDSLMMRNPLTKEEKKKEVRSLKVMLKRSSGIRGGKHQDLYIIFHPKTYEEQVTIMRYDQ